MVSVADEQDMEGAIISEMFESHLFRDLTDSVRYS